MSCLTCQTSLLQQSPTVLMSKKKVPALEIKMLGQCCWCDSLITFPVLLLIHIEEKIKEASLKPPTI